MDNSGSKIHKLGSKADRNISVDADAGNHPAKKTDDIAVRYVAIPQYDPAFENNDDTIDLLALWSIIYKHKIALLSIVLIALLISAAIAVLTPPAYRAELVMAPASEEKGGGLSALAGQFGGLASLAGVNFPSGGGDVDRILATLKSRAFLLPFIKEEKIFRELSAKLSKNDPSMLDAYFLFTENLLEVRKDTKTGLVTLSIEWQEPTTAATWANNLVSRLNEHQRKHAIREAEESIEYLNKQLQQTGVVDMQQAIYRLIEAQTKIIMLANVKKEYVMHVIDPAIAPEESVRPKVSLIIILGLVVGLMLGVFLVFILHTVEALKLRVKSAN